MREQQLQYWEEVDMGQKADTTVLLSLIALAKCNFQCVHNQSCSAEQSSAVFSEHKLYPENMFEMSQNSLMAFQMFFVFLVLKFIHDP